MRKDRKSFWLEGLEKPIGCNFYLLDIGELLSAVGEPVYQFGGYNCWHLVTEGSGFVKTGEKTFRLQRGDLFSVMYDGEITYGPLPGTSWKVFYLRVEGEAARDLSARIGLTAEKPVVPHAGEEAVRMFHDLFRIVENGCRSPEMLASRILRIVELLSEERRTPVRTRDQIFQEALRLLSDPMHTHLNVNELASALGTSRVTLFQAFRKSCGKSPLDYLQELRLKECMRLLRENPGLSLDEIRKLSAFPNGKSMDRAFKRMTDDSPGEYRKRFPGNGSDAERLK